MDFDVVNATEARQNLYRLIDQTAESSRPIFIKGRRRSAILMSEDDYNALREMLHLEAIPGMVESIVEGMKEPLKDGVEELDW